MAGKKTTKDGYEVEVVLDDGVTVNPDLLDDDEEGPR